MKLKNANGHLSELPETHRPAIVGLIDLAVEANMDKVLAKLDKMQVQMDAKLDGMQMQIAAMQRSNDAQFSAYATKVSSIKWFIFTSVSVLGVVLSLVGLALKFL